MPRVKVPVPAPAAPSQPVAPVMEAPAQVAEPIPAPVHHAPKTPKTPLSERFSKEQKLYAVIGVAFLILIIMLFSVMQSKSQLQGKVDRLTDNPSAVQEQDVKKIVAEVGKHLELPTDETPVIATVGDVTSARKQSPEFFAKAANGDVVLLYSKAKEAILYRPSTKKIIVVAPFSSGTPSSVNGSGTTSTGAK